MLLDRKGTSSNTWNIFTNGVEIESFEDESQYP